MTHTLLYELASFLNAVFGYWSCMLVPFAILVFLSVWQARIWSFNLSIIAALLSILPALTPSLTQLLGYNYFTMLNYDLQQDDSLKSAAALLISIFTTFFILGATLPNHISLTRHRQRYYIGYSPLITLLIAVYIIAISFLESGTVFTKGYGVIKLESQAPFSSLANQFINLIVATFLCYLATRSRQRIALIFYIAMIMLLLLLARRTLALTLTILAIYSSGANKLSLKVILFLCASGFLLVFIGEARSVGIVNYINGMRSEGSAELFFSLPGGASNVFVGSMGVIHMLGREILSFPETFPIILWPTDVYESSIYRSLDYDYNGGMHIANILYWNFGIFGLMLGGVFLGWVTTRAHLIASKATKELGGTYPAMLAFAYIITLPNLFWYHPLGTINLSIAVTFGFVVLSMIKPATKPLPPGKW